MMNKIDIFSALKYISISSDNILGHGNNKILVISEVYKERPEITGGLFQRSDMLSCIMVYTIDYK